MRIYKGFTLIEVLIALAILAISLTAILKSTSQSINTALHLENKTISHLVAMQGVAMLQLNLLLIPPTQEINEVTTMFGQRWYWRATINPTPIKTIQQIKITVSKKPTGPFIDELQAYRLAPQT